jgi:hypothetical protein
MNNNVRPAVLSAKMYGTKVSVEYDHSDIDLDEVMDAFQTLLIGMGYHPDGFKNWVIDRAAEYKEENNQSENEEFDGLPYEDPRVIKVIDLLNDMEVDGEVMQYILEAVGMDEQMAIQLCTSYPDAVEEHINEMRDEQTPYISDNFQIGPDGAYEHNDGDEFMNEFMEYIKTMKATKNK